MLQRRARRTYHSLAYSQIFTSHNVLTGKLCTADLTWQFSFLAAFRKFSWKQQEFCSSVCVKTPQMVEHVERGHTECISLPLRYWWTIRPSHDHLLKVGIPPRDYDWTIIAGKLGGPDFDSMLELSPPLIWFSCHCRDAWRMAEH